MNQANCSNYAANVRRHGTKFSRPGDLPPGIYGPMFYVE